MLAADRLQFFRHLAELVCQGGRNKVLSHSGIELPLQVLGVLVGQRKRLGRETSAQRAVERGGRDGCVLPVKSMRVSVERDALSRETSLFREESHVLLFQICQVDVFQQRVEHRLDPLVLARLCFTARHDQVDRLYGTRAEQHLRSC
jgi:hypothetical protein